METRYGREKSEREVGILKETEGHVRRRNEGVTSKVLREKPQSNLVIGAEGCNDEPLGPRLHVYNRSLSRPK